MKLKLIIMLFCVGHLTAGTLFGSPQEQPQSRTVSGIVVDEKESPLVGASVYISGSRIGVNTDFDGRFKLEVPTRYTKLQVSYIGFVSQEVDITRRTEVRVVLVEDRAAIQETVVTGYQTFSPLEFAGAYTTFRTDPIYLKSQPTIDKMLQGVVPGMLVSITSGEPGVTSQIRIRGTSTISSNKAPVWVVDGVILEQAVPFDASQIDSEDAAYLIGNAIAGLSPQDIESITVLKDASATAIYGVRAANGVIVLTTRKGAPGAARVQYDGNVSFKQRPSYANFDRMNSQQRIELSRDIVESGLIYSVIPSGQTYEGVLQELMAKRITQDEFEAQISKMQLRNTNWFKELFTSTITQSHNVAISGGTQEVRYYFSSGYSDDKGGAKNSSSARFNAMGKINASFKWIDVEAKLSYSTSNNEGYNGVNPFNYAYNTSRTLPLYNEDGSYHRYLIGSTTSGNIYYNIMQELENTGNTAKTDRFESLLSLNIKLMDGLKYRGTFAYNINNSTTRSWATDRSSAISRTRGYDYGLFDETHQSYQNSPLPYGGTMQRGNTNAINYTVRNALEYSKTFRHDHLVNIFAGFELKSERYTGHSVTGYGWNPIFGEIFMPVYTERFITDYVEQRRLNPTNTNKITQVASVMGTFSYSYRSRYVLNGSIRSDGSNKFGSDPKYRWLPTWMISGLWNISSEEFVKNNLSWLDHMGLRASYGLQGNLHDQLTPNLIVGFDARDSRSGLERYTIRYLPNPELRWEQTSSWNIGFDIAILGNRLKAGFDIYGKNTTDLILDKTVPTNNGRAQLFFNAGEMVNRGFEGYLQYRAINSATWHLLLGTTFGRNTNEIILANGDMYSNREQLNQLLSGTLAVEGAPIGAIYSYQYAGLSAENGYPLFIDENGRKVHMGDPTMFALTYSGSRFPTLYGGFSVNLAYKKHLFLDLGFTYNIGNVKRLPNIYDDGVYRVFDPLKNVSTKHINRWRQPGDEKFTNIPVLYDNDRVSDFASNPELSTRPAGGTTLIYPSDLYNKSDLLIAKGDFLKFKSLRFSYLLPESRVTKGLGLSNVRINFQVVNIFFIADKKWAGVDPESANASVPNLPTYTLGMTLNF